MVSDTTERLQGKNELLIIKISSQLALSIGRLYDIPQLIEVMYVNLCLLLKEGWRWHKELLITLTTR